MSQNLAGMDTQKANEICKQELAAAGIEAIKLPFASSGEVKTHYIGSVHQWSFRRAWYYWVAEGPGIPLEDATALHERHGKVVRVHGHCGCPSPLEWCHGFAVGMYHVDSADGLKALVSTINSVYRA